MSDLRTPAAAYSAFVISLRFQRDPKPLDSARVPGVIEFYTGNADARIIAPRDNPRKKVKLTIVAANGGRIQHTFDLVRIASLRLHDLSQPL